MPEIAFVSPPELSLGAAQSGLRSCPVESADLLAERLLDLAGEGVSVAVVTEDLVGGRIADIRERLRKIDSDMALLVVPRGGGSAQEYLEHLRQRFAAALGVDVWETAVKRSGVGSG